MCKENYQRVSIDKIGTGSSKELPPVSLKENDKDMTRLHLSSLQQPKTTRQQKPKMVKTEEAQKLP